MQTRNTPQPKMTKSDRKLAKHYTKLKHTFSKQSGFQVASVPTQVCLF